MVTLYLFSKEWLQKENKLIYENPEKYITTTDKKSFSKETTIKYVSDKFRKQAEYLKNDLRK
jgi:hypothetical protein